MNRKPRSQAELYRWHTETLEFIEKNGATARGRPAMNEDTPQCGWFMRRLVPKGPFVPCRVWVEPGEVDANGDLISPERWCCEVDGQRRDVGREWTWICGYPISEDKYFDMLAGTFAGPREAAAPAGNKPAENITENITYKATELTGRMPAVLEERFGVVSSGEPEPGRKTCF